MSLVLDSSVALAWQMPDEESAPAQLLFERFLEQGAIVPGLWRLEVANALLVAERRGRLEPGFTQDALADFSALPFEVDEETDRHAWTATRRLAERFGLTVYDASYLELAQRSGLPLATLDQQLARAARECGVRLAV